MGNLFEPDATDAPRPPRGTAAGRFARVAPEQGLETSEGLTYAVPDELADLRVGDRVLVPLGRANRTVSGYVLAVDQTTDLDPAKIKPIAARQRESVNLPDTLIALARWIGEYYCCPMGMVLATMLPAAVKHGTGIIHRKLVQLADPIAPEALPSIVQHHKLPPKQRAVLEHALALAAVNKLPIDPKALADQAGARSTSPVRHLVDKGLLHEIEKQQVRAADAELTAETLTPVDLTDAQQRVVDNVTAAAGRGFSTHLLHGVTGSGKTEVYIRIIEPIAAAGQVAIVLVPEISLTPQTVGRFVGRFDRVAVLHSGLTPAQRHEQWLLIRDGWAQVVVGARSAVFAPTDHVGLIIVDEEHDASYKQDQLPRYHGRDVAIKRGQMHAAPVLLGSATPSLESYYNATVRRTSTLHDLPRRVRDRPMPRVEIVDMLAERKQRAAEKDHRVHLLSRRMEHALRQTFDAGGQALLLLNRRGYASYIACPDLRCGWIMSCEFCDVRMVYHRDPAAPLKGYMQCHYCGYENRLPRQCPTCGNRPTVFGLGTQRVEEEIRRKLPEVRMLRMDSDAMRTGRDYHRSLESFRDRQVDLLVGTQMIAKGLDFPNVRMVGVVSADTSLHLPDFRAAERTFQLVAQVAGRSGRGDDAGQVVVQTFTPDAQPIQFAARHDYPGFARWELANRAHARLPPIRRMARIVCRDRDQDKAADAADAANAALVEANQRLGLGARLLGPMLAPIARIGGFHRMQIEIIADTAAQLQRLLGAARAAGAIGSDYTMAIDVDPVSLL